MSNVSFLDALEMTTVTFSDESSITGRVHVLPHGGYSIQHVVRQVPTLTLFVEYVDMT